MTDTWEGPAPAEGALARCVGDVGRFVAHAWGRQPSLHARTGDDTFADLLSIDDVDRILTATSPRRPAIRVVRGGREVPAGAYTRAGTLGSRTLTDLPDIERLLGLFDDGATIVLQGLQRTWPPVGRLCRGIESYLTHPVQANAYLTPPSSQGLNVHHDTHDVFALQTYGRKRWVTYAPLIEQPLPGQRWRVEPETLGDPEIDTELVPGDCLYVPRGTLHAAATTGDASLHLTLGVRVVTWHDVARRLVERTRDVAAFREALPVGFARRPEELRAEVSGRLKQLVDLIADADADAVAECEAQRLWAGLLARPEGALRMRLDDLDVDALIAPRDDLPFRITVTGDRLRVRRGATELEMPAWVEPAVRAVLTAPVRLDALPGGLDPDSARVLVGRLVREGMVVVRRDAP
ncbi:MAG TPA: cupin domain-containing protein [Euzebyales bacterium]|nr:cupin domain-containing protein [Euzebyales bacterium]